MRKTTIAIVFMICFISVSRSQEVVADLLYDNHYAEVMNHINNDADTKFVAEYRKLTEGIQAGSLLFDEAHTILDTMQVSNVFEYKKRAIVDGYRELNGKYVELSNCDDKELAQWLVKDLEYKFRVFTEDINFLLE